MRRAACLALAVLAAAAIPGSGHAATSPIKDLQVISQDTVQGLGLSEDDTQVEPSLAQDPNHPDHLVSAFQEGRYPDGASAAAGFATSHDGGVTWTTGELPNLTTVTGGDFDRAGDQVAAFGPDGAAYAVSTQFDGQFVPDRRSAIGVLRSDDGGLTWNDPVQIAEDDDLHFFNDNPNMAVDTYPTSPHYGRVYVAWLREHATPPTIVAPFILKWSDDGGRTWSDRHFVSNAGTNGEGDQVLVQPNGDLTVVWQRIGGSGGYQQGARTSTDGGLTFGPVVKIAVVHWHESRGLRTGFAIPSATVDPVTGDLHVVWQDSGQRPDGKNDVVISSSTDGGATWSPIRRVNQDPTDSGIDHLTPDVAAYGGDVAVTYRTRQFYGGRGSNFIDEVYIESIDGGQTFGPEMVVGPPSDIRFASQVLPDKRKFFGAYVGLVLPPGEAHLVWAHSSYDGPEPGRHQTTWAATMVR